MTDLITPPKVDGGIVTLEEMLRRKKLLREDVVPPSTGRVAGCQGQRIAVDGKTYHFEALEVAPGVVQDIALFLMNHDTAISPEELWTADTKKLIPASSVVLYQVLHRLHTLRDDPAHAPLSKEVLSAIKEFSRDYSPILGTLMRYGERIVVVSHMQPNGEVCDETLEIPPSVKLYHSDTLGSLVLPSQRKKGNLHPRDAKVTDEFLQYLFGRNSEHIEDVLTYVASMDRDRYGVDDTFVPRLTVPLLNASRNDSLNQVGVNGGLFDLQCYFPAITKTYRVAPSTYNFEVSS